MNRPRRERDKSVRPSNYRALATDYDGTIAHDGRVDDVTLEALRRARSAGLMLVLVTGRELPSLFDTFPHPEAFDRIVAENGGVLLDPSTRSISILGSAPPATLLDTLRHSDVPISVGHALVATTKPYEERMRAAIREAGVNWHVVLNKDAVMALPQGVDKATGLQAALTGLGVSLQDTIGVGDAENDAAFLAICGWSVAVDNALPAIKATVDQVTGGARGVGVCELIARLLSKDL